MFIEILTNFQISFDIESNGLISAAPFICQSVLTFFGGWYTDYIRSKGKYFWNICSVKNFQ